MKKLLVTQRELEILYGCLKEVESGLHGIMELVDKKYTELVLCEKTAEKESV